MSKTRERKSRRQFIKTAAVGAAGVSLTSCAATELAAEKQSIVESDAVPPPENDYEFDVAVVGAGVSGCYVAYRLLHGDLDENSPLGQLKKMRGGTLSVGVFEYSGRVAGRLLSAELPLVPAPGDNNSDYLQFTEFGGFRFQPQMHILRDLGNLLFNNPPGDVSPAWYQPFPFDEAKENFYYLRGQQFRLQQLENLGNPDAPDLQVPYNLRPSERKMSPGDLSTYVINQAFASVLPDYDKSSNMPAPPQPILPPDTEVPGSSYITPRIPVAKPNGYSYLRYLYHQAFRLAEQAENNGDQTQANELWKLTRKYRLEYQHALHTGSVKGRSLIDWPWWSLMHEFLSEEAIQFMEDSSGYNSLWTSGSVSFTVREDFFFANEGDNFGRQAYPYESLPDDNTAWHHVKNGYSDFADVLYEDFLMGGGNKSIGSSEAFDGLNHQLVRFERSNPSDESDGYDLLFYRRESGTITPAQATQQCREDPKKCRRVHARYIVLAMPKRALQLLDQDVPFFRDTAVVRLLDSVLDNRSIRLFMAYKKPWWQGPDVSTGDPGASEAKNGTYPKLRRGRSNTDLPIRQFYYWLTGKDGPSIVLASYTNARAQRFWQALEQPYNDAFDDLPGAVVPVDLPYGTRQPLDARPADPRGKGPRAATNTMARMAHRQLVEVVFGKPYSEITSPPDEPYYAHYQDWSKDPWGAGWHGWPGGQDEYQLIPQIIQPRPSESVYIVGECYSNIPGWVQGALNVAEVMLQTKLGLQWPSWLTKGGTWLGPGSEGLNDLA